MNGASRVHVVSDGGLRSGNPSCLRGKARDEAERHGEDQTQRRDDSSEQIDEFVGRHDPRVIGKPDERRAEREPCTKTV